MRRARRCAATDQITALELIASLYDLDLCVIGGSGLTLNVSCCFPCAQLAALTEKLGL